MKSLTTFLAWFRSQVRSKISKSNGNRFPANAGLSFRSFSGMFWQQTFQRQAFRRRDRTRMVTIESMECRTLLTVTPFFGDVTIDSTDQALHVSEIVSADLNNDGFNDVVSISSGDGRLSRFMSDGNGGFQQSFLSRSSIGSSVEVVDIDQNGWLDILDYEQNADGSGYSIYIYADPGSPTPSFGQSLISVPAEVTDLKSADIDGDGDIDLVAAFQFADAVVLYENAGALQFQPHLIANSESLVGSVAIGDIDGDADLDIVYGAFGGNSIGVLEQTNGLNFVKHTVSSTAAGVADVSIGDINGDGSLDVVAANQNSNSVDWYQNTGGFAFSSHQISDQVTLASSTEVADIDDDGDLDVVSIGFDGRAAWHDNSGNGTFTEHVLTTTASEALSIIASDLDGDGTIDIAYAARSNSEIGLFKNDGNQNFDQRWITFGQDSLDGLTSLSVGDLDRDGDKDVVTASYDSGALLWQDNDGHGDFVTHTIQSGLVGLQRVVMQDLDGDGDQDLIITQANLGELITTVIVQWLENDGANNFTSHEIGSTFYGTTGEIGSRIRIADLDKDGKIDVAVSVPGAAKLLWYQNDGAQNFTEFTIASDTVYDFQIVDFDRDGDQDLIAALPVNGSILAYTNDDAGNFNPQTIATDMAGVALLVAADFDRDGDIDLFAHSRATGATWALWNANSSYAKVVIDDIGASDRIQTLVTEDFDSDGDPDVLLGDRQYVFDRGTFIPNSSVADNISATGDFDGDGDADIVFYSGFTETLEWIQNRSIDPTTIYPVNNPIPTVNFNSIYGSPEDIDRDGDLDFLTIQDVAIDGAYHSRVIWWANDGVGNFAANVIGELPYLDSYHAADILDVDGDGDLDIVAASDIDDSSSDPYEFHRSGKVILFANDGHGTFALPELLELYEFGLVNDLKHADLDGDGDQDLVFVDFFTDQTRWLENDGDGNFASHSLVPNDFSYRPSSQFTLGDLDNDGDIDLIESDNFLSDSNGNSYHHGIVWLENDGHGVFTARPLPGDTLPRVPYIYGGPPLKLVDFDHDGDSDLVGWVATTTSTNITWFENDGQQQFTIHQYDFPDMTAGYVLEVTDIDEDGDIDLLVTGAPGEGAHWLENDGNQNLTVHNFDGITTLAIDDGRVLDINGDGRKDVLYDTVFDMGWLPNLGGQIVVQPTVLSIGVTGTPEGFTLPVFKLDISNSGFAESWPAVLAGFTMHFSPYTSPLESLTNSQIGALVDTVTIAYDVDHDGIYTPAIDNVTSALSIIATSEPGTIGLVFDTPDAVIPPAGMGTAFVLLKLKDELLPPDAVDFDIQLNGQSFISQYYLPYGLAGFGDPLFSEWTTTESASVSPVAINDRPVVSGFDGTVNYRENATPISVDNNSTVIDVDSFNFDGGVLTVWIAANKQGTDNLSMVQAGTGISVDESSQVLVGNVIVGTLTGGTNGTILRINFNSFATVARVQRVLRAIGFSSSSDNPSALPRTVRVTVSDGDGATSLSSSKTLTVTAVNDAPVITGFGATVNYRENAAAVRLDTDAVVNDVDSTNFDGGVLKAWIFENKEASDKLSLVTAGTGVTTNSSSEVLVGTVVIGTYIGGQNGLPLQIIFNSNATPARVQTVLRAIGFSNSSDNPSTLLRMARVTVSDGDGATSLASSKSVRVTAVNDAPAITGFDSTVNYTENSSAVRVDIDAAVSDIDSSNFDGGVLTVWVSVNSQSTDLLSLVTTGTGVTTSSPKNVLVSGVIVGTYTGGNNNSALQIMFNSNSTPTRVRSVLRAIGFSSSSDNPSTAVRTLSVNVSDGDGATSLPASKSLSVIPVNDAPVIAGFDTAATYTENSLAVRLDPDVAVNDADSSNFDGGLLKVWISANRQPTDALTIVTTGTGVTTTSLNEVRVGSVIIGTYSGGNSGTALQIALNNNATPARVRSVLRAIGFLNTSENPSTVLRTISVNVSDGDGGTSVAVTKSVQVIAVNDKPVLTALGAAMTYSAGDAPVLVNSTGVISDVDSANFDTGKLTVRISANGESTDRLTIRVVGTGATQISTTADFKVFLGPVQIGTYSSGNGATALIVTMNVNVTPAVAKRVLSAVQFHSTSATPSLLQRTISVTLSDGDGGTSAAANRIIKMNDDPVINSFGGSISYTRGAVAKVITTTASVTDASANFNNGSLKLSLLGSDGTDVLSIKTSSALTIANGNQILLNGLQIGTFIGGTNNVNLVISLTSNANASRVTTLLKAIQFSSTTTAPLPPARTLQVTLTDGLGGASSVISKLIDLL